MVLDRSESRVTKDGCWFCRLSGLSPYVGGELSGANERRSNVSERRWRTPAAAREEGAGTRRRNAPERGRECLQGQSRTNCVRCVFCNGQLPSFSDCRRLELPIVECTALHGVNAFFSYSSSNRLTYFFDPRMVLTLGSLARTTVVPWEFRQVRLCRLSHARHRQLLVTIGRANQLRRFAARHAPVDGGASSQNPRWRDGAAVHRGRNGEHRDASEKETR